MIRRYVQINLIHDFQEKYFASFLVKGLQIFCSPSLALKLEYPFCRTAEFITVFVVYIALEVGTSKGTSLGMLIHGGATK